MRTETHPARSPEFLSRLHDGDLTAAERAHFESHRAHCGECRHAAAEFEAALSLFRSSQTSPAEPDLASRILRRLQSASPRRRPFGVFYGIDLRWAGAFAAALIAMIIGSAVVLRQPPRRVSTEPTPIPVILGESRPEPAGKDAPRKNARVIPRERPAAPPAPASPGEKKASAPVAADAPSRVTLDAARAPSDERAQNESPRAAAPAPVEERDSAKVSTARKREAGAARPSSRDDPSGGERSAAADFAALESAAAPLLFVVTPVDGEGSPPARISEPRLSAELRGRSFILVVGVDGRVLEVLLPPDERRDADRQKAAEVIPEALRSLRFEVGVRPRRLLLSLR